MTFDIRKIDHFLAVVEYRNISNAAEALRISQPTLSRQINALEQQFKVPLFVRHGRGVLLTEAGKRLYEGLRGLEHQLRVLRDDVAATAGEPSGEVALGIPPSPRKLLAVPIAKNFLGTYPKVAVRLCEQTSGDIRDLVARGEVDLGIVASDEPEQGIACDRLVSEPMLLVGPLQAALSLDMPISVDKMAPLPLILTTNPNSLRRMIEREFTTRGLRPHVHVEANTLPLITDLVEGGLGYTVLPSCSVLPLVDEGILTASPLEEMRITWTVARPLNRNMSIAARLLSDVIFRTVDDAVASGAWPLARIERECTDSGLREAGR